MAISECLRGEVLYLDTFRIFSELCKILFWYTDGMGFAVTKQGKFSRVSGFVKSLKYVSLTFFNKDHLCYNHICNFVPW